MYTQCPECQIAFRVSAKILQQAGGNVRCGGCGHAFSALSHLSEEMPDLPDAPSTQETDATDDKLAETSRRLLKTLDELAGPEEIKIEDTGVEWRVLGEEDEPSAESDEPVVTESSEEEPRYDDNTPLPDDLDEAGEDVDQDYGPPLVPGRRANDALADTEELDDRQRDLALSEPEEWTDLLYEVSDSQSNPLDVEEELAAVEARLLAQEDADGSDNEPTDIDAQFESQVESLNLEATGTVETMAEEEAESDNHDLSAENADDESLVISASDAEFDELDAITPQDIDAGGDDDLSNLTSEDDQDFEPEASEDPAEEDDQRSGPETSNGPVAEYDDEDLPADLPALGTVVKSGPDLAASMSGNALTLRPERESTGEFEAQIDAAARALLSNQEGEEQTAGILQDELTEDIEPLKADSAEDDADIASSDDVDQTGRDAAKQVYPPQSEEELSVNMEIDRELMALATQDDEFSATLVGIKSPEELFKEHAEGVETIVMEGEYVLSEIDRERLAAENAAKSQFDDPVDLSSTSERRKRKMPGGRRWNDPLNYRIVAAIALLGFLLIAQLIHNARNSLATVGLFDRTIAPVYRLLGSPVRPEWDIKGWQFEVTTGNMNDEETTLTIVSRLANRSEQALPYPLVHVSLTDRWEEIMGSRLLEPREYLAGDLDPGKPIKPGEKFTAVIAIDNPSIEATGFKLNVCYRDDPGQVRCAIEDFKE